MTSALLLCSPLTLAAIGLGVFLPFIVNHHLILTVSAVELIVFICLFQLFSGTILPNFIDGANPERVSTNSMGLLTLAVTSLVIILSTWGIYSILMENLSGWYFILVQTAAIVSTVFLMYHQALKAIRKYQF